MAGTYGQAGTNFPFFFFCSRNLQYVWRCGDSTPRRYNLVWTSSKTTNPVSRVPIVHSAEIGQVRPGESETCISVRAGFSTQEGLATGLGLQTNLCILQRTRVRRGVSQVFRPHQQETFTTGKTGSVWLGERPRCQRALASLQGVGSGPVRWRHIWSWASYGRSPFVTSHCINKGDGSQTSAVTWWVQF